MGYGGVGPDVVTSRGVVQIRFAFYEQIASGTNLNSRGRLEMLKLDPDHQGIATFSRFLTSLATCPIPKPSHNQTRSDPNPKRDLWGYTSLVTPNGRGLVVVAFWRSRASHCCREREPTSLPVDGCMAQWEGVTVGWHLPARIRYVTSSSITSG
jgi:hypothetical protein